ncbi:Proteins incorrectly called adenylate cyclase [hydrothermal vent metagenome]|uniref:Proteins incorrectly called adenylate cyclase n=1 Tax=hydrothermal vent metagenome TaxID=652676 RepID=A0A3B0ZSU4_9ZZZZ
MPKCAACQFDNSDAMKFCGRCGGLLPVPCSGCQFINPTAYNFCGQCGKHLNTSLEGLNEATAQHQPNIKNPTLNTIPDTSAERRQLTVMFCDLADSALLSDCLDPEEFQYIIRRYQGTCTEVISRFGGHIAQFLGDGILVYFGYPKANEDDARRAVYSAINCVKAIIKLNTSLGDTVKTLQIRIGIHTGLVVIGEMGAGSKKEHLALGRTPNIAARLQHLAAPNQVFITDSTYHLVRSFFRVEPQGQKTLKGIRDPVDVYHVAQEIDVRDRFEAIQKQGNLIPIIGRQHELKQLTHLWNQSLTGRGKVLLLVGETGVGKSRLLQAFKEKINDQNNEKIFLTAYGTAYSETSSLRTIIEMLERAFEFTPDMNASTRFKSLEIQLSEVGFDLAYYLPLFSSLLHLPLADDYEELDLTAERKKKRTLEVVFEYIFKLSAKKPLLFIVEDLHWTDPSTLEFLEMLVQQTTQHRILALFTSRPRFNVPWHNRSEVNLLNLSHLKDQDISEMVEQLTQGQKLPQTLIDEIIKKTDGIPLFVEEITLMVMESKASRQSEDEDNDNHYVNLSIPTSLQDLLTARLDNLGRVRDVAQLAAVIGREFSYSLLEKITDNKATLQQDLKVLIDSELIFQSGVGNQSCYIFKHALFQETAVFSMLKTRRQEVHRKIATIAETQNPEIVTARPEYIALHYTRAGAIDSAIDWWLRAGELALKKSANIEAISHLEQGILLSESLPDTLSNNHRELSLRSAVGAAYCATTGYASKEVEQSYNHAWELCKRLDDTSEQFPILWGQWAFHVVRANLDRALEIAMEMFKAANVKNNPNLLLEANMSIGLTHYFLGNFTQARDYLEASVKADKTDRDRSFTFRSGQDAGVCARSYLALTLWVLGHPAQAKKCSEEAIILARTLNHPFSLSYALNFSSWLHYMLHDPQKAKIYTREELYLAEENGFFWLTLGSVVAGWADTQIDAPEQGIIRLQLGINDYRLPGARLSQTFLLSIQASVCLELNMLDDVKLLLDEAITAVQETQEAFWLTEIYRLYGHLAQAHGQTQVAYDYLNKSITLAQKQGAPMLQLRATESLVRFSTAENRPAALKLLIAAYAKIDKDSELVDCHNVELLIEPATP